MSDRDNTLAKGTIYLSLSIAIFVLSGYIINVWLGRYLGPIKYGLYGVVVSVVTIINTIQTSGIPQALSKFVSEDPNNAKNILKSSLNLQIILGFTLGLTLLVFSVPLSLILNNSSLIIYFCIASAIFPIYAIFSLYVGYYNGLHQFGRQAILNFLYSISKAISVVVLAYYFKLFGAIIGLVIAPVLSSIAGVNFPKSNKHYSYKKIINYSYPLIFFSLISTAQVSLDLFFVQILMSSKESAGFYTASQNISRIPYYSLAALSLVIFPAIAKRLSSKEYTRARNITQSALRYLLILLVPLTFLIIGTSNSLVKLFYGNTYISASNSLSILVVGYAALSIFSLLTNVLNAADKSKLSWIYSSIGVLGAIISYIIFIPIFGLNGAAIGTCVGAFLSTILAFFSTRKYIGISLPYKSLLRCLFTSVILFVTTRLFQVSGVLLLPWYLLLMTIYFLILYKLNEFNNDDIYHIKSLVPIMNIKRVKNE
jgi:stage V sporulation protein B